MAKGEVSTRATEPPEEVGMLLLHPPPPSSVKVTLAGV